MRVAAAFAVCLFLAGCAQPDAAPPAAPPGSSEPPARTGETQTGSADAPPSTLSDAAPSSSDAESSYDTQSAQPNPVRDTGMMFDVAPDVPQRDLDLIRLAFAAGGDYIAAHLGGDIPADFRANVTVKIVATGQGDPSPYAGGSCCTAFSDEAGGGMRPFFDVAHDNWLNWWAGWPADPQRETSVIHEYTHGWQNSLGCINLYSQPLGDWMNEGIAMQVSYAAMIERGAFVKEDVLAFMESSAKATGQWNTPLWQQEEPGQSGLWSGHIGHLALEVAMDGAPNGLMQLRDVCVEAAKGATLEEAFEVTFGQSLNDFYVEFELWKAQRP